ncbi:MAG: tetratricopeptide repeat protein [Anaerolineaceae bacterium]|nr:tetratricopeptide repeat protein [Anaerolineaceae bacterium]
MSPISQAWNLYRQGQPDTAIVEFERILSADRDNVDALYGIGLAQRAAGQYEAAVKSFETALQLVKAISEKQTATRREVYGDKLATQNDPSTPEDDRYMMLVRMLTQRVTESKAALESH